MKNPRLQVLTPVPTTFFHCMHCERIFQQAGMGDEIHQALLGDYPEEFIQDSLRLAEWLSDLAIRHGSQLLIQVVDPQSVQGFLLSLRFRVRSYPAFILDGRAVYTGWDRRILDKILDEYTAGVRESNGFTSERREDVHA